MTVYDYQNRNVPEYSRWMYLDGYSAKEIMYAFRKSIAKEIQERQMVDEIKIVSEVKVK